MENSSSSHLETERYNGILRAAERLFAEKGYHTVSIEQIAKVAGVSKGLVHYHFTSKEQLLAYILKDIIATLSSRLDAIAQGNETAQAKIRAAVEAYLDLSASQLELLRITLFEGALTEKTHRSLVALNEENKHKLAGLVEDGIGKGEFKPVSSGVVARLLMGAIVELAKEAATQQWYLRSDELADGITEILCDGIRR